MCASLPVTVYRTPSSIWYPPPPPRYCSFGEHIVFVALVSDQGLDDNRKACVLLLFFSFAERIIAFVSLTVLTEQSTIIEEIACYSDRNLIISSAC